MKINIEGKEGPKKRWLDFFSRLRIDNMRVAGECVGDMEDQDKWRSRRKVAVPK